MSFSDILRYIIPALSAAVLLRCALPLLLNGGRGQRTLAILETPQKGPIELTSLENTVGRSLTSDIRIKSHSVAPVQGAIMGTTGGQWTVYDLKGDGAVYLRGKRVKGSAALEDGDRIRFGTVETVFSLPAEEEEENNPRAAFMPQILLTLLIISVYLASGGAPGVLFLFAAELILSWASFFMSRLMEKPAETETLAFLAVTLGFGAIASSDPSVCYKEALCLAAGVLFYWGLCVLMEEPRRSELFRLPAGLLGLGLLAVALVSAPTILGAKNWIKLGFISFQPSELVKAAFVFAGSAPLLKTLDHRRNIAFVVFSALCVLALAAMGDFGTALVFFCAYLVMAFMRSGSFGTLFASVSGTVLAAFLAVLAKPYIAQRFSTWGHAWEAFNEGGYQQTRTMIASASGGLFGLGIGQGWFKSIFAADTDMVFGLIAEEQGLICAFCAVFAILALAASCVNTVAASRGAFYAISSCAAATVMLTQLALNVFGSLDILPFTGVTFPFVSKGGTSLIASWALLAFIKAASARWEGGSAE